MPLAQSIELPPPTATIRSMRRGAGEVQRGVDVPGGRVLLDVVEDEDFQAGRRAATPAARCGWPAASRPGSVTSSTRRAAEFARQLAQAVQRAGPEDDARQRLEVERRQRRRGLPVASRRRGG